MTNALPDPQYQTEYYDSIPMKRFMAWIIDVIFVTILVFFLGFVTFALAWFMFPVIDFLYRWITLSRGSATLGMRIMSIEIRNWEGAKLSTSQGFLHTAGYYLSWAFVLLQVISVAMIAFGPRRQGLHDLFLGTAAINRPR